MSFCANPAQFTLRLFEHPIRFFSLNRGALLLKHPSFASLFLCYNGVLTQLSTRILVQLIFSIKFTLRAQIYHADKKCSK